MEGFGDHACSTSVIAKKFLLTSVKSFCSSARHHPLLFVFVFFILLLYRSFPCVLAFLLSNTPILLCTALLLGVLLSYGQPNPPEIDGEIRRIHEIASLSIALSEGETTVVKENGKDFTVKRFVSGGSGGPEEGFTEIRSEVPFGNVLAEEDEPRRVVRDGRWVGACASTDDDDDDSGGAIRSPYMPIHEEDDIVERVVATTESSFDPENSQPTVESGKPVQGENTGFSDSGSSGSESDEAGSSSPDELSLPDIVPAALDELHPLLNSEALQPSNADAASDISHTDDSHEEDGEDDNEEEEDEHEYDESKGDEMKFPITWTEDDQKNLMDLGTLELERNQRLENLIARRRARKDLKMTAEKNLIDLDSSGPPFSGPHISTSRHNPFDLPYEQSDDTPLLPGSAPSVLLPGQNPFDLPYGSTEENPNQTESSFSVYRRHESFSAGPSVLGFPRGSRQEVRFRPFFVPEEREEDEVDDEDNGQYLRGQFGPRGSSISEIDLTSSASLKTADEDEDIIPSPAQPGLLTTSVTKSSSDPAIDDHDGECSLPSLSLPDPAVDDLDGEYSLPSLSLPDPAVDDLDGEYSLPSLSLPGNGQEHQLSGTGSGLMITSVVINSSDCIDPVYDSSPPVLPASAVSPLHAPASEEVLPCQDSSPSDGQHSSVAEHAQVSLDVVGSGTMAGKNVGEESPAKRDPGNGNGMGNPGYDNGNGVVKSELDGENGAAKPDLDSRSEAGEPNQASVVPGVGERLVKREM